MELPYRAFPNLCLNNIAFRLQSIYIYIYIYIYKVYMYTHIHTYIDTYAYIYHGRRQHIISEGGGGNICVYGQPVNSGVNDIYIGIKM